MKQASNNLQQATGPDYVFNVDFAIMYRNGEIKGDMSRILHEALCRAEKIGVETPIKNVRIFRQEYSRSAKRGYPHV